MTPAGGCVNELMVRPGCSFIGSLIRCNHVGDSMSRENDDGEMFPISCLRLSQS